MFRFPHRKFFILMFTAVLVLCFAMPSFAADKGKININTATAKDLTQLKGIGMKTAEKIIAHREQNGPFKNIEAIQEVPGIGKKTFEEIQSQISVE